MASLFVDSVTCALNWSYTSKDSFLRRPPGCLDTYPRRIRRRSNLGHIFQEKKVSYGTGNMVLFVYVWCDARMTNTYMKIFSDSQPRHDWATKPWFRDSPFPSSGSMRTVTENQRYVRQSVWWVFLLLVCWVMGVENAMQHTPLPPQTLFCAANPQKSSSNHWQAFICHSLMWSYRRILAFTVTKCNKVFSGNQHHKHGVPI